MVQRSCPQMNPGWMIGCECAIYQKGRFRLGPLANRGVDSQERFTQARSRNWSTHWPTEVAHDCPTEPTNNCLDNQERLRKEANSHKRFTQAGRDWEQSSDRPNNRPRTIKQPKAKWINNWGRRLGKAKRDRTSNQTINWTIENDCTAKPRMIANDWSNEYKNDYNHLQHWTSSGVDQRSRSGARGLEPVGDQEPTEKAWYPEGWCRKINTRTIPDSIC